MDGLVGLGFKGMSNGSYVFFIYLIILKCVKLISMNRRYYCCFFGF